MRKAKKNKLPLYDLKRNIEGKVYIERRNDGAVSQCFDDSEAALKAFDDGDIQFVIIKEKKK